MLLAFWHAGLLRFLLLAWLACGLASPLAKLLLASLKNTNPLVVDLDHTRWPLYKLEAHRTLHTQT